MSSGINGLFRDYQGNQDAQPLLGQDDQSLDDCLLDWPFEPTSTEATSLIQSMPSEPVEELLSDEELLSIAQLTPEETPIFDELFGLRLDATPPADILRLTPDRQEEQYEMRSDEETGESLNSEERSTNSDSDEERVLPAEPRLLPLPPAMIHSHSLMSHMPFEYRTPSTPARTFTDYQNKVINRLLQKRAKTQFARKFLNELSNPLKSILALSDDQLRFLFKKTNSELNEVSEEEFISLLTQLESVDYNIMNAALKSLIKVLPLNKGVVLILSLKGAKQRQLMKKLFKLGRELSFAEFASLFQLPRSREELKQFCELLPRQWLSYFASRHRDQFSEFLDTIESLPTRALIISTCFQNDKETIFDLIGSKIIECLDKFNTQELDAKVQILEELDPKIALQLLDRFNVQDISIKESYAFKLCKKNPKKLFKQWDNYKLNDVSEKSKTEMLIHLISTRKVKWDKLSGYLEKLQIQQESNKIQIAVAMLSLSGNLKKINGLDFFQFSTKEIEAKVIECGLIKLFSTYGSSLSFSKLIQSNDAKLVEIAFKMFLKNSMPSTEIFERICLKPILQIPDEFNRLRVLRCVADHFLSHSKVYMVCENVDFLKQVTAILMIRQPELRERLLSFWTNKFLEAFTYSRTLPTVESFNQRCLTKEQNIFHSHLFVPMERFLNAIKANRKELKAFLAELEKSRANLAQFSVLPIYNRFSPEIQEGIAAIFKSYQAYQALHSPEKFDEELLNPMLQIIHRAPRADKARFARSLCGESSSSSRFEAFINTFSFSPEIRDQLIQKYHSYQDGPKKWNFEFIEVLCGTMNPYTLREKDGSDADFVKLKDAIKPTFRRNYHAWIEALLSIQLVLEQNPKLARKIINKLNAIFRDEQGNPVKTNADQAVLRKCSGELNSLIALLKLRELKGYIKDTDWKGKTSFSQMVNDIFMTNFQITDVDYEAIERFQSEFFDPRFKSKFAAYFAKLKNRKRSNKKESTDALHTMIESVVKGTFAVDRFSAERSPTMRKLQTEFPDLYRAWTTLDYSRSFRLDEEVSAPSFNPFSWLHEKLIVDKHLDMTRLPNLRTLLVTNPGEFVPPSGSSSSPNVEDALIQFAQASTEEEQIQGLEALLQFPLGEVFEHDVHGALELLRQPPVTKERTCISRISNSCHEIMRAGTYVHGSCQDLTLGDPAVMSYLDGKFIPILNQELHDQDPSTRALLKIDFVQGKPILFLERYYKRNKHPQLVRETAASAIEITQRLNAQVPANQRVSLITSADSMKYFPRGKAGYLLGEEFNETVTSLKGTWSPIEYSDVGAGRNWEDYQYHRNLHYLYQAPKESKPSRLEKFCCSVQ